MEPTNKTESQSVPASERPFLKLFVELGPLAVFFFMNAKAGIFWGTGSFVVATVISLAVSRVLFGRVAVMPLVTAVFVVVFGGLTLWLQDETFIKIKPTVVNGLFAAILLGGLLAGYPLMRYLFADVFHLTDEGWQKLTLRWGCFFVFLAVINEVIWRSFTTDTWVAFKAFGIVPLTMVFALSQIGLLKRYESIKD